jgi:acetolactate synthase-1/3 small subunit
MVKEFTLTVFTENRTGVLSRVVGIITRRHINIESVSASESSIDGIHKIVVVVKVAETLIQKLIGQLDKQVDVLKSFYYDNDQIVYQEIALYKIPSEKFYNGDEVETLVREYNARILRIEQEYIVVEKAGYPEEIVALLNEFKRIGIYEFIRSGRVVIVKEMERLNTYLQTMQAKAN